jgi:hypothetical protein
MHKFLFYNKIYYMPLHVSSTMCSSPGGKNCIIQHLVSSHTVGGRPVRRRTGQTVWWYQTLYNTICIVRWERLTSVRMCYTATLLSVSTHSHRNTWNSDFWRNGSPNIGYHNTAALFPSQEEYSYGTTVCLESTTSLFSLVSAWL